MSYTFENIKENILSRRSIKPESFNGKKVSDNDLKEILELANWAPTHGYTEPWRFVIFEKENIAKFSSFHALLYKQETPEEKYQQKKFDKTLSRTENVSHVLAIVMKRGTNAKIPACEEHAATAIAVQNIWLGATSKGISCYWGSGGMTYHPKMKSFLGFGDQDEVMGFLYLGYTDNELPKGRRLSGIDKKVRYFKH